jgi:ABC-2 type transport system permease protein
MLAVFRRELKAYFTSPLGFAFVGFFILLAGIFFAISNLLQSNPNYTGLLQTFTFIFMFLVPILTMRLLSDDAKQKTDQLLITSPLSVPAIVLGKYLAAIAVFLIVILITALYPVIMSFYSIGGLAGWEILGGYIGFFLLGAAFIAVGLFFSSTTDNQMIAAVETYATLLVIWILEYVANAIPATALAGLVFLVIVGGGLVALVYLSMKNTIVTVATSVVAAAVIVLAYVFKQSLLTGLPASVLGWFSLMKRYNDFTLGILGLSPIVYYISFAAAFVFLTIRMIEKRRWA